MEIDRSLTQLTELYGFETASRAYLASLHAVAGLKSLVLQLGVACELRDKDSLYLAAGDTNRDLLGEHQLRERAGLPGDFLDHRTLLDIYGIARAGAIVSPGAADADPMQLARGLLRVSRRARRAGVQRRSDRIRRGGALGRRRVEEWPPDRGAVRDSGNGLCHARDHSFDGSDDLIELGHRNQAAAAEGLERRRADLGKQQGYLYARTTSAGRIIIGGEDSDEMIEPDARDHLIPEKSGELARKLAALWPVADVDIEFRWSGTFDTTSDGLPLIGPVPHAKGIYAAYGYGGNGITFSFLAAQLIGDLIAGSTSRLLTDFALDRDGGPTVG
jgi:glycine/D-amino acid oxidase-like deaminating enzyme